jgi:hypothetical protein
MEVLRVRAVSPVIPQANEPESVFAKDSPTYEPLPSIRRDDNVVLTRWLLSEDERKQVAEQGYLYVALITRDGTIQPLKLTTVLPEEFENYQPLEEEWPTVISG